MVTVDGHLGIRSEWIGARGGWPRRAYHLIWHDGYLLAYSTILTSANQFRKSLASVWRKSGTQALVEGCTPPQGDLGGMHKVLGT
jgi:hypothetical protein